MISPLGLLADISACVVSTVVAALVPCALPSVIFRVVAAELVVSTAAIVTKVIDAPILCRFLPSGVAFAAFLLGVLPILALRLTCILSALLTAFLPAWLLVGSLAAWVTGGVTTRVLLSSLIGLIGEDDLRLIHVLDFDLEVLNFLGVGNRIRLLWLWRRVSLQWFRSFGEGGLWIDNPVDECFCCQRRLGISKRYTLSNEFLRLGWEWAGIMCASSLSKIESLLSSASLLGWRTGSTLATWLMFSLSWDRWTECSCSLCFVLSMVIWLF